MATKFVYTDQEITEIVAKYKANVSLETLADEYNKSVASIRMKLVKLGVYVAKSQSKPSTSTKEARSQLNEEFNIIYQTNGPALV